MGVVEGSKVLREHCITQGRFEGHGRRGERLSADYVLVYRNTKLAVIEAKASDEALSEGVAKAKNYAGAASMSFPPARRLRDNTCAGSNRGLQPGQSCHISAS